VIHTEFRPRAAACKNDSELVDSFLWPRYPNRIDAM
jgi:hypothetical protein